MMLRQTSRLFRLGVPAPTRSGSSRGTLTFLERSKISRSISSFHQENSYPVFKHFDVSSTSTPTSAVYQGDNPSPPPPALSFTLSPFFFKAGAIIPGILDPLTRIPLGVPMPSSGGIKKEYITPNVPISIEDPLPSSSLRIPQEAPSSPVSKLEKLAARLIVIRRTKMNKHKLRKLRKKMHFKWTKIKQRRYNRREKAFLDEKLAMIHDAMKFDAKDYVAQVIKKAKEEPLPRKWTDPLMPDWFREQEMAKEARLKRYQKVVNMYLNKGIKIKIDD